MSSSYIVEPQGTAPKKDDTLIIVVNDDGTISVDQETLQNLIMNQSNANVSVVRVGQTEGDAPNGDLTFTVDPPAFVQPETNQNPPQQTNTTPDIVDPFMEMDPEQLERLETALQSEQAKQILGENVTAMLDMLTVEEQQNSIRYSIELDHCYTSRTSSADPPPLDPLPIADSPDVEKVEFTTAASLPQSPLASEPPEEGKLSNQVKPVLKKPVGRPRKVSLPINSPPTSTKPLTSPRNLPETPKTSGKPQEDDEDSQFSSSESSESDPSDDDVDFGPRGPRRGGVRARGGRKGLTTRGGSMSGRRPGRPSKMDVDQVRRLNMEMAAAVDEMKTPVKHESSENHLGRSRKQIKTMGGKRKEEVAPIQANSNVNEILAVPVSPASSAPISMPVSMSAPPPPQQQPAPSPPPAPLPQIVERPLQTTNQVKANLISANMIKGDMILTKPGQSRNNQKVYFVQKKIVMKANELKSLGAKKAPVVITKGPMKVSNQIQTKLATSEDGKLISVASKPIVAPQTSQVPLEVHSFVENTQQVPEVPVIPEVPPLTPAKQSPKHTVSSPVKVKPILEIKKEKKEKEKEKPEEVPKIPELKTPEPCKKHLKKDTKKSPAVLAEALGPALFSTPDIIRRVGSTGEAKAPDALGNSDCGTSVPEPMDVSPSLEAQIAPVKTDFLPLDLDIRPDEAHHHDLLVDQSAPLSASVDEHSSALLDAVEHDHEKMDQQDSVPDDLTSALDAATNPLKNEDVGNSTEDTVRSIVSDERSEIEGNEHLLATLEMEASKHEEELLAEALLLQEQLDVDLSDPTALDGASPTVPSLPEPLLSTSDFDSAILPAPVIPEKAPESPVPAPVTPTTTTTNDQRKKGSKEPIQIVRGGRVITLPPIEAPATRSKRLQSRTQSSPKIHGTPKREEKSYKPSAQNHSIKKVEEMESEMEDDDEEENSDSEDDPNRLWCICKRPHNNRFMICCDVCEDWFHGKCVHVSKAMGQQMEEQGIEWVCPNCSKKKSDEPSTPKSQKSSPTAVKSHRTPGTSAQTPKLAQPEEENVEKSVKNEAVIVAKSGGVTQCVVCKKEARNSSIYCSDACILAHAQETLTKDKPIPVKAQGKESQKSEARVIVFERKTGKVLTGNDAPTRSNLQNWLKEHPTFEAIRANNLNTMQVGGKTVTTIQTGGSNNKSMKSAQQQNPQAKMIYAKVAGSKQTVLAPSHKKVGASPSASSQSPNVVKSAQTKTQYVITPSKTPVLKQTTIKTVPQQNKTPTVPKLVIKKTEQKASTSVQKGSHQRTLSSKKSEPEPIRLNVRKTLAELLTTRIKETEDLKLTEDEITDLGLNIELELYKYFKDTGAKYKAKYRSLVFNIKDSKNLTLFRKIADRSLTPDAVVRLSPDEMASQELAEWREKETKHQLEMIKKNELDLMAQAKSIVVKTHKGEQIIENDGGTGAVDPKTPVQDIVSVLNSGDNTSSDILEEKEETTSSSIEESRKLPKHGERKKKKDKDRDRDKEKDKDKERERESRRSREKEHKESKRDRSTSRSRKHRSRDRSRDRRKSKDGKREKERDRDKERDRGREKDKDKEKKDKDKERSSRRSKSSRSKSSHRAEHKDKDKKKIDSEDEKKVFDEKKKEASPPQSVKPIEDRLWRHVEEETTTNTIDGNDSDLSDREPSSTVNIKTPDINEEPEKDKESIGEIEQVEPSSNTHLEEPTGKTQAQTVWRGFVSMVDVAKFFITAQEISGSAKDLMDDLPGTIDVVGRISHDTVWDYISKMKKSGTKEILVIRLTAANDEEKIPYITLYSYLNSRSRLGVIGAVSKNIKDFYIMPFSSQSKIPSILMPLIGSGFEENRPHLLLGIIVRNKRKRPSVTPLPQIPQKIAKKDPERSFTPPPSVHSSKEKSFLLSQKNLVADFNDETVITQTTLNSLNKAHVGMSRPGGLIDSAVISKIVPELSSKFNITASPKKAVSQDRDDDQDNSRLNDHDYDNEDTGDNNEDDDNDDNDTPVSAVSHSVTENNDNTQDVDNDDDEPYSPGGIDDDIVRSSLLPRAENSTELQRKMEELNRQIEEQKQQIQSISSSFLGETVSTLPGLGLDPPSTADDEAYSPTDIRSFTPPPQVLQKFAQPILDKVQDITIPPNLQEILANVKRQQGSSNKVDPYLPSKPGASFLTSSPSVKPEKTYTPTSVKPRESKSTLRSLSDFDLIKKAEEELAAVAAASAMNLQEHPPSIMPPMMQQVPIMSPSAQPDSHFGLNDIPEMAYPTNIMDTMSKARASDQPKPPGLEDEDLPTFPSTPPNIELPNSNRSPKFLPKSGVILSVKRKSNDDGGSPSKTSRTKSRWGQGPAD